MITPSVLADVARELLELPRLTWHNDPVYGITLEAVGTDAEIRGAVWTWASAFGIKPVERKPDGVSGWIVAELPILGNGVTVAGRPVEAVSPR